MPVLRTRLLITCAGSYSASQGQIILSCLLCPRLGRGH